MSDRQEAEIEKLRADARKADVEARKLEQELARPWFRRPAILQSFAAGLVAVPLVWFYVTEIAIPLYEIETISLTRQNEEAAFELQKRERDFDARLTALVQEKDEQERDYLARLASLEGQKERLEKDRQSLQAQYAKILDAQEISEEQRLEIEAEALALQRELDRSQGELQVIRQALERQAEVTKSSAEAVALEFEKLRPVLSVDPSLYSNSEALVVSVSEYDDPAISSLPGAKVDGEEVSRLLELSGFSVTLLENPTKSDIETGAVALLDRLNETSRFLVYWVGHGAPVEQAGVTRGYFVPRDCIYDTLIGCLPMEYLLDLLERANASSSAAIVDTSFANLAFPSTRGLAIAIESEAERQSREIISATNANGVALDTVPGGTGPVVQALKAGLGEKQADFNADGVIRMRELFQFITQSVVASTGGRQIPTYANLIPNGGEMVFFADR